MKRSSSPLLILLTLLLLGMLVIWNWPVSTTARLTQDAKPKKQPLQQAAQLSSEKVSSPAEESAQPVLANGRREMQAYRFAIKGGAVLLEASERIEGEFHRRRGAMAWMPGMWCVRVLDADLRVLAQETTPAPDEPCVVLDPHVTSPNGTPKAAHLKATDDVMTQVRLPSTPGARWVKVYRLSGTQPAGLEVEPLGQLLASIPLPP